MEQLGIKALRPGPSGNEAAPNHANYDEALANPYPHLPEVLTLANGRKVTNAAAWWKQLTLSALASTQSKSSAAYRRTCSRSHGS